MDTLSFLILAALFLAVSLGTYSLGARLVRSTATAPDIPPPQQPRARISTGDWVARITAVAGPLARLALPAEDGVLTAMRMKFLHAGLRHPDWPKFHFAAKALLALALPAGGLFLLGITEPAAALTGPKGRQWTLLLMFLLASLGYLLPATLLRLRTARHQRELTEALPDAIDLMIVCLEAGLGLDAAIARAATEIRLRSAALADELHLVGLELRVGASRGAALRNFALRTGLDEANALVVMLNQADRFGTGIAESLRTHADGLRTRRRQAAEEAAAKVPLKLLFPLIFCIFPSLLLVLMGPAALSISRVLLKTTGAP